jgi:hypothetical protein
MPIPKSNVRGLCAVCGRGASYAKECAEEAVVSDSLQASGIVLLGWSFHVDDSILASNGG